MNKLISRINQVIRYLFYGVLILVPLVMYPTTYELFEFNKMWVTFGITLIVVFVWTAKIIISGKLVIRRTPLDIPIFLFLLSQILSTIFSIDRHVSIWGYYSRFNGGLLSTVCYIFLYYALASNVLGHKKSQDVIDTNEIHGDRDLKLFSYPIIFDTKKLHQLISYRVVLLSLIVGIVVALWGLPSHFGQDPTCLIFRGSLDITKENCWTDAFQPTIRIFSTLGQPNWLAAYLAILIPLVTVFFVKNLTDRDPNIPPHKRYSLLNFKFDVSKKSFFFAVIYFAASVIFYIDLIYTDSASGFVAAWMGVFFLFAYFLASEYFHVRKLTGSFLAKSIAIKSGALIFITFIILTFVIGSPLDRINFLTIKGLQSQFISDSNNEKAENTKSDTKDATKQEEAPPVQVFGGSDSGEIRQIVWNGSIDIFKRYPLFGSGVETFAYSYYQVKPKEHNLTSEWDFLYNKAHNEFLNYLATTGIIGLGTYLLMIGYFLYGASKTVFFLSRSRRSLSHKFTHHLLGSYQQIIIICALIGSYITIHISNFFGFSVVIVNIYLFLIPLLVYEIGGYLSGASKVEIKIPIFQSSEINAEKEQGAIPPFHIMLILVLALVTFYFEFLLYRFWLADIQYSQGYNFDKYGGLQGYIDGNIPLTEAVNLRPGEDLFQDELSINLATLALIAHQQGQATQAASLSKQAEEMSNGVVKRHPNNVVYYKTRTRVFYNLSQINARYFPEAINSIVRGSELAPTDAKIWYNMGLLFSQQSDDRAIAYYEKAIEMKQNYYEPRYYLATHYIERSKQISGSDFNKESEYKTKAREQTDYILKYLNPNDKGAKDLINEIEAL